MTSHGGNKREQHPWTCSQQSRLPSTWQSCESTALVVRCCAQSTIARRHWFWSLDRALLAGQQAGDELLVLVVVGLVRRALDVVGLAVAPQVNSVLPDGSGVLADEVVSRVPEDHRLRRRWPRYVSGPCARLRVSLGRRRVRSLRVGGEGRCTDRCGGRLQCCA